MTLPRSWKRYATVISILFLIPLIWSIKQIAPWIPFFFENRNRGLQTEIVCSQSKLHCVTLLNYRAVMSWNDSRAYVLDGERKTMPASRENQIEFADDSGDYEIAGRWLDETHVQIIANHSPLREERLSADYTVTVNASAK